MLANKPLVEPALPEGDEGTLASRPNERRLPLCRCNVTGDPRPPCSRPDDSIYLNVMIALKRTGRRLRFRPEDAVERETSIGRRLGRVLVQEYLPSRDGWPPASRFQKERG